MAGRPAVAYVSEATEGTFAFSTQEGIEGIPLGHYVPSFEVDNLRHQHDGWSLGRLDYISISMIA